MSKRGQVVIFVMLGIIILLASMFLFSLKPNQEINTRVLDTTPIESFASNCITVTLERGFEEVGYSDFWSLENYINSRTKNCTNNFDSFIGFNIIEGNIETEIDLSNDNKTLIVNVLYPLIIKQADSTAKLDRFYLSYPLIESGQVSNNNGVTSSLATIVSSNKVLTVDVPNGITALREDGTPIDSISIRLMDKNERTSFYGNMVSGIFYDMQPHGASFSQSITLTIKYDEFLLPDDIDESQLRISNYDSKGAWVPLSTTVDEVNNLITVQIDHFSDYTLSYVQRPEKIYDRTWFIQGSTVGEYRTEAHLGRAMALQGDYNGDGVTDFGGFNEFDGILGGRCNDEGMWFFRIGDSTTNECFGKGQTIPAPADYDGDNKTDLAVYEYSTGTWYFKDGSTEVFGDINVSVPVPADYDGDEERLKSLGYLGG